MASIGKNDVSIVEQFRKQPNQKIEEGEIVAMKLLGDEPRKTKPSLLWFVPVGRIPTGERAVKKLLLQWVPVSVSFVPPECEVRSGNLESQARPERADRCSTGGDDHRSGPC